MSLSPTPTLQSFVTYRRLGDSVTQMLKGAVNGCAGRHHG